MPVPAEAASWNTEPQPAEDRLARLSALECRYSGPIPDSERRLALFDFGAAVEFLEATGHAAFYAGMLRGQIKAVRMRRADGTFYPAMLEDLRLYLAARRRWVGRAAEAARRYAAPAGGAA